MIGCRCPDEEVAMAALTLDEVIAIKNAHEHELFAKPNVHGVGVGSRFVGGEMTDEFAIFVYVTKKSEAPGPDRIPDMIEGVSVVVVEEPRATLYVDAVSRTQSERLRFSPTEEQRPLFGGISVGPCRLDISGTLGLIMSDGAAPYALSCHHVLYGLDKKGKIGDTVTQPG